MTSGRRMCYSVPPNEFERWKNLFILIRLQKYSTVEQYEYVHWSLLCTRKPWSTVSASSSTESSKVLTILTSRPFWVPNNAPRTVWTDRQSLDMKKWWENWPKGRLDWVRSFNRVRCSDILGIGKGWLIANKIGIPAIANIIKSSAVYIKLWDMACIQRVKGLNLIREW